LVLLAYRGSSTGQIDHASKKRALSGRHRVHIGQTLLRRHNCYDLLLRASANSFREKLRCRTIRGASCQHRSAELHHNDSPCPQAIDPSRSHRIPKRISIVSWSSRSYGKRFLDIASISNVCASSRRARWRNFETRRVRLSEIRRLCWPNSSRAPPISSRTNSHTYTHSASRRNQ